MPEYYFDTETTGGDLLEDKIITIQWQRIGGLTGEPIGDLNILREWDSSEEEILRRFLPNLKTENPFDFIMVGESLLFDFMFLSYRTERYGIEGLDLRHWHDRAWIDLKPIFVMINEGRFKGWSRVIDKPEVDVPRLYREGKYSEIIKYIRDEAVVFLRAYQILKREMPSLRGKLS